MAIAEETGRGLVGSTVTGNHIGRNRPGSATEAEQRRFLWQLPAQPPHRLEDRLQMRQHAFG